MPVFVVHHVHPLNNVSPFQGIFLVLLNAGKRPPHIALLINGKVYSLTHRGTQIGEPLEVLMKSINIKTIKTLFFKLTPPAGFVEKEVKIEMEKILLNYNKAEVGTVTCLAPVKDFFELKYNLTVHHAEFVFDLLPLLDSEKVIENVFHLHMEKDLKEGKYFFEKYTMEEINSNLNKLNKIILK